MRLSEVKNITSDTIMSIAYGNGVYVAVGSNGYIAYSSNLRDWTQCNTPTNNLLYRVIFDGIGAKRFFAVGYNKTILVSDDGIDWASKVSNNNNYLYRSIYADYDSNKMVVWGIMNKSPWTVIMTTSVDNGETWTDATYAVGNTKPNGCYDLIVYNSLIITGNICSSVTSNINGGIRTASVSSPTNFTNRYGGTKDFTIFGLAHNNDIVVAVASDGRIATSTNGITWTTRSSGTTRRLSGVTWLKDSFYAVGDGGLLLKSNDGISWSNISSVLNTTENIQSIATVGDKVLIVGSNGMFTYSLSHKHLIKSQNKIQILLDNQLQEVPVDPDNLTQQDFEIYGMDTLYTNIQLPKGTQILTWTDDPDNLPQISKTVSNLTTLYLVSFDNRLTWKSYINEWKTVLLNEINIYGMTKNEIESISEEQWNEVFVENGKIDYAVALVKNDTIGNIEFESLEIIYKENLSPGIIKAELSWKSLTLSMDDFEKNPYKITVICKGVAIYQDEDFKNPPTVNQIMFTDEQKNSFKPGDKIIINAVDTFNKTLSFEITFPDYGLVQVYDNINGYYQYPVEGISFDDAEVDYDFYTTPENIKLRPLQIGTLVGGTSSTIHAVEVINSYANEDYSIELQVAKDNRWAKKVSNYSLLDDAPVDEYKTKVEMSLVFEPFSPMYPLVFDLSHQSSKIIYIRVTPQLVTSGPEKFQIKLVARPK